MRAAIIFSAILHLLFFAVIFYGLPSLHEKKLTEQSAVVVEILPIGEFTNVKSKPRPKVVPKIRPKAPTSKAANAKRALPDPKVKTKPKMSEPKPKPPKVVKKPKPEPKIVQKDIKPIARPKKKEEKKVVEKKKQEEPEMNFNSVLNTLENIEESLPKEDAEEELDFGDIEDMFNDSNTDYNPDMKLSITEELAIKNTIRNQVSSNWSTISFSGAKDVHKMQAKFLISFKEDGEVVDVEIIDMTRYYSDRSYKTLVDSAKTAILKSSPIQDLPIEIYAGWKKVEFNFDPSQMMY